MRSADEILASLRRLNVRVWRDGERLRYSAPKDALTPELRAELSERKSEILTFLAEAKATHSSPVPPLLPVARKAAPPLSFAQEGLWFMEQLEGESPAYNIPAALRLTGTLDADALARGLTEIVRRHETLRTSFPASNGGAVQSVAPARPVNLASIDLRHLPETEKSAEARRLTDEEAQRPFDVATGPLFRATLLRLSEDSHVLLLTMHHLVSDGWSMGILIRELGALYEAYVRGGESPLAELSVQYADYAEWQRAWLKGEVLERQMQYWRGQLRGAPPLLDLPTDRERPRVQSYLAATEHFEIDGHLARRLKELSEQSGATLFMTLVAAYVALLARYSGQQDIVVGTPVANRNRTEVESLIGFFVNTLVLRVRTHGEPTFRELLSRVRRVALDAYAHQDLPFERLVAELQPARSLGHSPLFQAMFILQNNPIGALEIPGLRRTSLEMDVGVVRCDISLSCEETARGLKGLWTYKPALFDASTIARMSRRLRALLASIVESPDAALAELHADEEPELPRVSRMGQPEGSRVAQAAEKTPLSYHQERLWFIDQFETGNVYEKNPVYHNIPLILHLEGRHEADALEQHLNTIVNRHEALRTRIVAGSETPAQEASARVELKLARVDASRREQDASLEEVVELALEASREPFALDRELLVRATLFRMSQSESLLLVVVHHIVADRYSTRLIARELAELYSAQHARRAPQLPEPQIQYTDYTRWQRALPASALEPLRFYWKHQLGGKIQPLELPTDRPRPAVHTYTGAPHTFDLNGELARRVESLGARVEGGEFAVLLAAFKTLLRRYARQDTIVVGTTDDRRTQAETEYTVGPLANLLVLRGDLAGNPTFDALLAQTGALLRHARRHGAMPFDRLVLELNPEKDMSRTALFDVLFHFDDADSETFDMGDARAHLIDTNHGYGKYDINLSIRAAAGGLTATVVYNADLFDASTVRRMMRHFEVLLDYLTSDTRRRVDTAALLDEEEEHRQVVIWNSTEAAYPRAATIHGLFEAQAARTPDAAAVVCGDASLTYRELDARANRIAHHLRQRGVGRETLVAVCLERSVDLVAALLGVLKAGGAYLPFEPGYPAERLRFMLEDARISHLVTTSDLPEAATANVAQLCLLDAERERISAQPPTAPASGNTPRDAAYCIYTSGSTGQPKGVLIEHANVVRLLFNDEQKFDFAPSDVWTMFHSAGFDFSVWEMYGALLHGGRLVVVPADATKDPAQLLELLARHGVTILNQTPSAFYALAQESLARPQAKLNLRYVIFGGEALQPARLAAWRDAHADVRLVNMYGITETTVHVTFKEITDEEIRGNASNIGRPIPTTVVYVMDENLRLLPVGVPGEVCVGGAGVARGYLGRSDLTAEKFVPNPYRAGERMYRSGDTAKLLPNGELLYLGRLDEQAQVRGFRVEPGEIQVRLLKHEAVADACVVAREGRAGMTEVVAYVVPSAEVNIGGQKNLSPETQPARPLYELPNGMEIFYQNKNETDFLYEEIFEQQSYFKHGITLADGDCVFDIGANIGLFTLFVSQACKDCVVYAFEPIPAVFEVLRLNSELHGANVKLFECGVARETRRETFTFYPHVSIFSGRFADSAHEREIIKSFILNQQAETPGDGALAGDEIDELLKERLTAEQVVCDLKPLSEVIRANGVERIDLLKIDVEKSELDLLAGIDEDDWPKIKQIVMEVHNVDGRLEQIQSIIARHGFTLAVEQDDYFKDTSNFNLYAVRPSEKSNGAAQSNGKLRPQPARRRTSANMFVKELRAFLATQLPEYMLPSAFVLLDALPLTANGKIDRRALPAPEQASAQADAVLVAPRTPAERQVAAIWKEVLGLAQVGVNQNFFELGGHSLLATQVVSRLRDAYSVTLPVRSLFESPTLAGLAEAVERATAATGGAQTSEPLLVSVSREARRAKLSSVERDEANVHPRS